MTVPCAKSVFNGRNCAATPRQRGDCATVSGLSFPPPRPPPPRPPAAGAPPGAPPRGPAAAPPPPAPPPPRPPRPPAASAISGGILPSGGSMIIDVRLLVLRIEL